MAHQAHVLLAIPFIGSAAHNRHMTTIASFPLSAWAFALRIWAAMLTALGAAFWLQLDGASTAATTVGILALQTRGQAYQKAVYRMLGTLIGVVASFADCVSMWVGCWTATERTAPFCAATRSLWSL
jgi:hypothetical protein